MAKIYLVRHGQASLGAENYDELSSLGIKQSQYLGKYFDSQNIRFANIRTGTLTRHQQTADNILKEYQKPKQSNPIYEQDNCWDEFDFKALLECFLSTHRNIARPTKTKDFFKLLKIAMLSWSEGNIKLNNMESWIDFSKRVSMGINQLNSYNKDDNILVVTSGGVISMILRNLYQLSPLEMIDLNLQIKNTSVTLLDLKKDRAVMSGFNILSHLDITGNPDLTSYA